MSEWKAALYRSYVSSGQSQYSGGSAEEHFRRRRAYIESIIRRHFPSDRQARVLDIGCGQGALLYFLDRNGYHNIRGVDGSLEQIELSRKLGVPGTEAGEALEFLRNCPPESAEVVCLFDVLEHLTRQEIFDHLTEVRRVLSPNGKCIGHVPNAEGIFGSRIRYSDLTHEQAFTALSISQIFKTLQFGEIQCFEDKPVAHGAKRTVRRLLWDLGTAPMRLLYMAETGCSGAILSQNLLFVARRS